MARLTGAKIAMHRLGRGRRDLELEDGDKVPLGRWCVEVIHTPGHSPDSVCFRYGDALFTGDTLFVSECGRTDIPGGDSVALWHSLFETLAKLPDDIVVYPGHDYGPTPSSTLGHERRHNYTLKVRGLEDFVEFMKEP